MKTISKIIRYLLRYHVFISYSSSNKFYLNKLTQMIENFGCFVDYAPRDVSPMKSWREDIKHKIRNSELYVILTSQSALRKKIIYQEITIADTLKKPYLIIVLPDVRDLSDRSFGVVEVTQYIKWNDPQRDKKIKKIVLKGLFKLSILFIPLYIIVIILLLDFIFNP